MEDQLVRYRSKVRRREFFEKIKNRLVNMVTFESTSRDKHEVINVPEETAEHETTHMSETEDSSNVTASENDDETTTDDVNQQETSKFKYISYVLWFCFWLTCWMIAIELQFGIVFLLFSALFGIYFNTRTAPKAKNEISAYSVFNKNCESIKGTLEAEQFEREIRYGPMNVKH